MCECVSPWRPCASRGHSDPRPCSSSPAAPSPAGSCRRRHGNNAHAPRRGGSRSEEERESEEEEGHAIPGTKYMWHSSKAFRLFSNVCMLTQQAFGFSSSIPNYPKRHGEKKQKTLKTAPPVIVTETQGSMLTSYCLLGSFDWRLPNSDHRREPS